MKKVLVILLTSFTILSYGQEDNQGELSTSQYDEVYVQALNSRFDLLLSSGWKYIEMNDSGERVSKLEVSDRYKFLTDEELIDLSLKNKKSITVYRLTHKVVGVDTVDINFGIVKVTAKCKIHFQNGLKFKKVDFALQCGGTEGYVPDMRFVKNEDTNEWNLVDGRYYIPSE